MEAGNSETGIINKTMDRDDLFAPEARGTVEKINRLIEEIYDKGKVMTSWYGTLEAPFSPVGLDNRATPYEPLPGATDDNRIPWFLYWEIEWVMRNGPGLKEGMRVLDAGGTSSLFSCYLASLGVEVHSIDLNTALVENAKELSRAMGWNMHAYSMNMVDLTFDDMFFDHAFSICVFEHMDFYAKQKALIEIHRCLKAGGQLCLTFDYLNPAPFVFDINEFDSSYRNAINSPERVKEVFCATGLYEIMGNQTFYDNGKRYLSPPFEAELGTPKPYTFGALFLKKRDFF